MMAPQAYGMYRVWTGQAAPPSATESVLLVQQGEVVRGQYVDPYGGAPADPYGGPMMGDACGPCGPPPACGPLRSLWPEESSCGFLANPWVIGGAIAAAIAIPLALSDNDDGSGS